MRRSVGGEGSVGRGGMQEDEEDKEECRGSLLAQRTARRKS
jgi:hypothetical protein